LPKKLYPSQPVVGVGAIIICDGFWRKILKRLILIELFLCMRWRKNVLIGLYTRIFARLSVTRLFAC